MAWKHLCCLERQFSLRTPQFNLTLILGLLELKSWPHDGRTSKNAAHQTPQADRCSVSSKKWSIDAFLEVDGCARKSSATCLQQLTDACGWARGTSSFQYTWSKLSGLHCLCLTDQHSNGARGSIIQSRGGGQPSPSRECWASRPPGRNPLSASSPLSGRRDARSEWKIPTQREEFYFFWKIRNHSL